jgi:hypothetical protein
MESTSGQTYVGERAQGQSVGSDTVVGYNAVLLSSLDAHSIERKQMNSCNMGDEVSGHPATSAIVRPLNNKTKFRCPDDRVSLIHRTELSVGII